MEVTQDRNPTDQLYQNRRRRLRELRSLWYMTPAFARTMIDDFILCVRS